MSKDNKAATPANESKENKADLRKDRLDKLRKFVTEVQTRHKDDELLMIGNEKKGEKVDSVPTGSLSLDVALGVGGYAKGRIMEIYGPEASGKTTLSLQAMANAQKKGGLVGFVDMEQALDVSYATKLGVKFDESMAFCQPESGEQALQIAREMIESGIFDVVVVDSVAALVPQKELDGEIGDQNMGLQARMMGQSLRILGPITKKSNTLLIFINQTREKIGVMHGDPTTTSGGNALKFYASVRLRIRKAGGADGKLAVKIDGIEREGYKLVVKIVKNKLNSPQDDVEIPILFGIGVDSVLDTFSAAKALEVIKVTGRTYSFNDKPFGNSAENALEAFRSDSELYKSVEKEVRKKLSKE